jgi:hypothetical protein
MGQACPHTKGLTREWYQCDQFIFLGLLIWEVGNGESRPTWKKNAYKRVVPRRSMRHKESIEIGLGVVVRMLHFLILLV